MFQYQTFRSIHSAFVFRTSLKSNFSPFVVVLHFSLFSCSNFLVSFLLVNLVRKRSFSDKKQNSLFTTSDPVSPVLTSAAVRSLIHARRGSQRCRDGVLSLINLLFSSPTPHQSRENNALISSLSLDALPPPFPSRQPLQKRLISLTLFSLRTALSRLLPLLSVCSVETKT